jgi:hypothetical protein
MMRLSFVFLVVALVFLGVLYVMVHGVGEIYFTLTGEASTGLEDMFEFEGMDMLTPIALVLIVIVLLIVLLPSLNAFFWIPYRLYSKLGAEASSEETVNPEDMEGAWWVGCSYCMPRVMRTYAGNSAVGARTYWSNLHRCEVTETYPPDDTLNQDSCWCLCWWLPIWQYDPLPAARKGPRTFGFGAADGRRRGYDSQGNMGQGVDYGSGDAGPQRFWSKAFVSDTFIAEKRDDGLRGLMYRVV